MVWVNRGGSPSTIYRADLTATNLENITPAAGISDMIGIALDRVRVQMYCLDGLSEVSIAPLSTGLVGISLDEGPANAYVTNWSTSHVGVMGLTLMALVAGVAIRRQYLS